jgi:adenosine deaminase
MAGRGRAPASRRAGISRPRDVRDLPKTNLHLHLTGSLRPATVAELAQQYRLALPPPLRPGTAHGWDAFQERYDTARAVLRTAGDIRRAVTEAIEDNAADGCGWLEIQVDPTSYAPLLGGLEPVMEAVLDATGSSPPIPTAVVVASSWGRPAAHAETLAALAARYAPHGVVGFGLSNDERLGKVADFATAFGLAADAGLQCAPHAGFYEAGWHVLACVALGATRIGHGLSAAGDPSMVEALATRGVALEVCPTSYPPLGVAELAALPLRMLLDAGVPVALGSDDPLLFGAGLADQYTIARDVLGFSDAELAALARHSVTASAAPPDLQRTLLAGIDDWLAQ